eukprot:2674309-Pyramimonas_sp.AAC.1
MRGAAPEWAQGGRLPRRRAAGPPCRGAGGARSLACPVADARCPPPHPPPSSPLVLLLLVLLLPPRFPPPSS